MNSLINDLIFPSFEHRVAEADGKMSIFDVVRKKRVALTPEEWVRQHFIHYMIEYLKYPKSLISVEDGLKLNKMQKRSDIVVYDRDGNVFMVAECKSFKVRLDQNSMDQLSAYNQRYKSRYLALTNGLEVFICEMDYEKKRVVFISDFPAYN